MRVDLMSATRRSAGVQGDASGSVALRDAASRSAALPLSALSTALPTARLVDRKTARTSAEALLMHVPRDYSSATRDYARGKVTGELERGAARLANSAVEPVCDGRSATNDEDCDAGAECGARDAEICRAMAVREKASCASPDTNKRRASMVGSAPFGRGEAMRRGLVAGLADGWRARWRFDSRENCVQVWRHSPFSRR